MNLSLIDMSGSSQVKLKVKIYAFLYDKRESSHSQGNMGVWLYACTVPTNIGLTWYYATKPNHPEHPKCVRYSGDTQGIFLFLIGMLNELLPLPSYRVTSVQLTE